MFQDKLIETFKDIFEIKKVSFNAPSDPTEQDTLFVEVDTSRNTIKDDLEIARVYGKAFIYAKASKVPYGFLSKKIKEAKKSDTKDLFFYDFETNSNVYVDLVERSFSFVYYYTGQYDPNKVKITDIELEIIKGE